MKQFWIYANELQWMQNMCVINDPFGQTHSSASNDHYSHLKIVL